MRFPLYYLNFRENVFYSLRENKFLKQFPSNFPRGSVLLIESEEIKKFPCLDCGIFYLSNFWKNLSAQEKKGFSSVLNDFYIKLLKRLDFFKQKSFINSL